MDGSRQCGQDDRYAANRTPAARDRRGGPAACSSGFSPGAQQTTLPPAHRPVRLDDRARRADNIQYFGDDGATGLVFVEAGGKVLGKTKKGQTTCTLDAAAYRVLTTAAAKITAKDQATPQPGAGDTTSIPTLGTEVGAVSVLDPRAVSAATP